jgi:hypothetical protein
MKAKEGVLQARILVVSSRLQRGFTGQHISVLELRQLFEEDC